VIEKPPWCARSTDARFAAVLDVFDTEPLPEVTRSTAWTTCWFRRTRPTTPRLLERHATLPRQFERFRKGQPLDNLVDRNWVTKRGMIK